MKSLSILSFHQSLDRSLATNHFSCQSFFYQVKDTGTTFTIFRNVLQKYINRRQTAPVIILLNPNSWLLPAKLQH